MVQQIPLTQGKVALVDDDDYERLTVYRWHVAQVKRGYWYAVRATARVKGRQGRVFMHRDILGVTDSCVIVDHIDLNTLNNQRANLREATRAQNRQNSRLPQNNTSGFKGASWNTNAKAWNAQITLDGRSTNLGYYATAREAAQAYDRAAVKHFGVLARTNFSTQNQGDTEHVV